MKNVFKRPVSVLVVVYTRSNEILLLRRKHPADYWQSVTGSLQQNETPVQAAQRELYEETGLSGKKNMVDCKVQNLFPIIPEWRSRYAPEVNENTEHVFRLELPDVCEIRLNPDEHTEYIWLPVIQAVEKTSSVTNREAIQAIKQASSHH